MCNIYLSTEEITKIYNETFDFLAECNLYDCGVIVVCEQCGDIQILQVDSESLEDEVHIFMDELLESPIGLNWFYADGMWLCDKCSGITYSNEYFIELTEENIFEL